MNDESEDSSGSSFITHRSSFSSEAPQEREQVAERTRGQVALELVPVPHEDVLQRGGAAVVEVRPALADAAQRRRVELALADLVAQADVVRPDRRVPGWRVAAGTAVVAEHLLPTP